MRRIFLIAGAAVLAAGFYAVNPPRVPAEEANTSVVPSAVRARTEVARLAEAGMAMRQQASASKTSFPEPRPEVLFGK